MIGFMVDNSGDVVIEDNNIKMVSDTDLITQTVRQVLKTNLGEWWLNENEGIDFHCLLCKNPNYDQIEDNIKLGLWQIDKTFKLTSFDCSVENRKLTVNFTAINDNGDKVEITL